MICPLREFPFDEKILIVAHRGASGEAPENTVAAFDLAVAQGANMIELDVQRSCDDRLVVIHDSTLRRTTDGRGRVAARTSEELLTLDAGSWFDRKYAGQRIPLLDDVFAQFARRVYLNIEVKSTAVRDGTAELLIRSVRRHHAAPMVLISSFHHDVLREIKAAAPELATAAILHPTKHVRGIASVVRRAHADAAVCSIHQLTRRRVRDARVNNIPITVYTVNTPTALARVLRLGVSIVVTNYPGEVLLWGAGGNG